jgi:leucyl aminopeptidase (aminopeptidase T)
MAHTEPRMSTGDVGSAELAQAALSLVGQSLAMKSGESLVVVCDEESARVAEALARAGKAQGADVTVSRLDQMRSASTGVGDRPHKVLPDAVRRAMRGAKACVFLATAPHQELGMREELFHLVQANSIRHAFMPDMTPRAFVQSLALEYDRVALWGKGMRSRLDLARRLSVTSPAGTALEVTLADGARWEARLGEIIPGKGVALPAGALYGVPARSDGVFVANASVGEFFGARHGLLLGTPIRFEIADGRVVAADAPKARELQGDVRRMLTFAPNSDRIGVVAVGVNMGILAPTGRAEIDENLPGLHLVIGDPAGRHPEAAKSWGARTSFSACQAGSRVSVDGTVVIDAGKIVSVL